MLEFVTLRSEFCDTYFCVCDTHFRDLGGRKMISLTKINVVMKSMVGTNMLYLCEGDTSQLNEHKNNEKFCVGKN